MTLTPSKRRRADRKRRGPDRFEGCHCIWHPMLASIIEAELWPVSRAGTARLTSAPRTLTPGARRPVSEGLGMPSPDGRFRVPGVAPFARVQTRVGRTTVWKTWSMQTRRVD